MMKHSRHILQILVLAAALAGCTGAPETQLQITVNGVVYTAPLQAADTLDLMTLSTEFDAVVEVANHKGFDRIAVNDVPLRRGQAAVVVERIAKDAFLTLTWSRKGEGGTLLLRTLHPQVPEVVAEGKATSPGEFYLSYVYLHLVQKYDNDGNLLFYRMEPLSMPEDKSQLKSNGWWDFKKHVVDGVTYYSYHAHDPEFTELGFTGYNPGKRVLLDARYNPVREYHLLASRDGFVKDGDPIDGHDFWFFGPEHYIMSSYILRDDLYAAYLQEVENGKVVFDWWSTDHPEMAGWLDPAFRETAGADYVHFNSIDILPDGDWLCSFRHISSVVKIARADGSGDIVWRIAGADPAGVADFHGQHYARWHAESGSITLFDNGNAAQQTLLLRLDTDLESGAVSACRSLVNDPHFSQACGSLTFSGGNIISGWGIPGGEEADAARLLTEYDASGNPIFTLKHTIPGKANAILASYRSVKYE